MTRKKLISTKTAAVILSAALAMGMTLPVFAAGTNYSGTIGGTKTTTFDKFLVMDEAANVPNATFTYAVTAGEAKSYDVDGKKFEVLAGVDADKVTMAGVDTQTANTIAFAQGDTTSTTANDLIKDLASGEKYVQKTATLDFSQCAYTEPGVYRYVLTESGTNQGITNDADATRIVDVYVFDDSDDSAKKLTIAGYVLHSNTEDSPELSMGDDNGTAGSYSATKSQGFTNDYDTSDLTIEKDVTGNQASHDKYFEFTVVIANAVAGTVYDVDLTGADAASGSNSATIAANTGKTNPASLTVGSDGTVTQKFYLQHGQQIKIQGLAKDTTYTVTENAEDYKSTANTAASAVVTVDNGNTSAATSGTIASDDLETGYLNTRNGVIPTGVAMAVVPGAIAMLAGTAGAVTLMMKRRRND